MMAGLGFMARELRRYALAVFRWLGGFNWVGASEWRRKRLLILCYHGVSLHDEHEWDSDLFVTPEFLRRRFEILRDRGYAVLPLEEAVCRLRNGTLPRRSVVLTFDDGFHDYFKAAVPLLEEFGFPATNYVSTYYCLHQTPIPGVAMDYLLWRGRNQTFPPDELHGVNQSYDLRDHEQRGQLSQKLAYTLQELGSNDAQQALLQHIAALLGVDWEDIVSRKLFHLMTPEEVADVARRGFDIQLHTHRHRTPRKRSDFFEEIQRNRSILESLSGRPARHFCYPSGDADSMFLPWLRDLNVETATTTIVSTMASAKNDPLLLPRFVDTMSKSELTFESWLSGVGMLVSPNCLRAQATSCYCEQRRDSELGSHSPYK
jgi:peptidoglycan/xylan/chitin deacetylase (PgdA/CDA1 family)